MSNPQFTESNLRSLLEAIQSRAITFAAQLKSERPNQIRRLGTDGNVGYSRPIYLRFDIDDQFDRAVNAARLCNEYGIKGTFFILNTANYWTNNSIWNDLRWMQSKGHEIAWHNNILTQYQNGLPATEKQLIGDYIKTILARFNSNGIHITGSASHGDPLCRKLGFINYEVFTECERTSEAIDFPSPSFDHPRIKMADFGLEYEAYHVPYDLYLSESGGREWTWRVPGAGPARETPMEHIIGNLKNYDRIQILIHPQHWNI